MTRKSTHTPAVAAIRPPHSKPVSAPIHDAVRTPPISAGTAKPRTTHTMNKPLIFDIKGSRIRSGANLTVFVMRLSSIQPRCECQKPRNRPIGRPSSST